MVRLFNFKKKISKEKVINKISNFKNKQIIKRDVSSQKKIFSIYKVNRFNINYGKSIKNLFNKFESISSKEFKLKNVPSSIKSLDSRTVLATSVYSFFVGHSIISDIKLNRAIESLNLIVDFVSKQRSINQPKYLEEFVYMFHELNMKKQKRELLVDGNLFLKSLIDVFNKKNPGNEMATRYNYVHGVARDLFPHLENRRHKFLEISKIKKEKFSLEEGTKYYIIK